MSKSTAHRLFDQNKDNLGKWAQVNTLLQNNAESSIAEERASRYLGISGEQMKIVFLSETGDADQARSRAMSPTFNFSCEMMPERLTKDVFARLSMNDMKTMFSCGESKLIDFVEAMPELFTFRIVAWTFEDGSGLVAIPGNPLFEMATQLTMSDIGSDEWRYEMTGNDFRIGTFKKMPDLERVLKNMWDLQSESCFIYPLESNELINFAHDLRHWLGGNDGWRMGFSMKNGATVVSPNDFEKQVEALCNLPKELLLKETISKITKIKKEKETRFQISWQDMICDNLGEVMEDCGDLGFSSFFMVNTGAFSRKEKGTWENLYNDVKSYLKNLDDLANVEIGEMTVLCSILTNAQVASDLPHFIYRGFRAGGASTFARKAIEIQKERLADDLIYAEKMERAREKGLPALLPKRKIMMGVSSEIPVSFARSVEFCAQYGCFLAVYCAKWAQENDFQNIWIQAKAFVGSMIGSEEISIKCYGYFAKLIDHLSKGKLDKEELERILVGQMEEAYREGLKQKQSAVQKNEIKNEWTGKWSQIIAAQRIREFLGLPTKSDSQNSGSQI